LREACELVHQYRYLRPLMLPNHADGGLATHMGEFRRIADALRALLISCEPGEDTAVQIVEGILEWTDRLDALGSEAEQEFALLYRDRAEAQENRGSQANWGAEGKAELKALLRGYKDAFDAAQNGLRTDALLGLLPEVEHFVDDYEAQ